MYAYWITVNYREAYGIFACNGILFNHESPTRGETFVTRKITRGLSRIKLGVDKKLFLGNINAKRDWGHAKDYIEMSWLMLQKKTPDDYVVATGKQYTVKQFINLAASELKMKIQWKGSGLNEKAYWINSPKGRTLIIEIDKRYFRPTEVHSLLGNSSKAKKKLGWKPKISFNKLVKEMIITDYNFTQKEILIKKHKIK